MITLTKSCNDGNSVEGGTLTVDASTIADGIGDDYKYETVDPKHLTDHQKHDGIIKRSMLESTPSFEDSSLDGVDLQSIRWTNIVEETAKWEPAQPVFISAQTGKGKNYFVEHKLLRYVKDSNYKHGLQNRVLILTNRLSLWRQELDHLATDVELDTETEEIRAYGDIAWVTTYQSFFQRVKQFRRAQGRPESQYVYVICDEAHFFTSDASFNPHTAEILRKVIEIFATAIRVYMSATPDECIKYIEQQEEVTARRNADRAYRAWDENCEKEQKLNKKFSRIPQGYSLLGNWEYTPMITYFFPRNYSYLDIKIYDKFDELYGLIANSVCNKGEKWLLFIDDWKKCLRVQEGIVNAIKKVDPESSSTSKKKDNFVYAVNANSKREARYQKLLKDEELGDITVLISTSVLDNGVNFKDIDNVVVSSMSPVKCVQMAGRARRTSMDQRKTLYIKRFTQADIAREVEQLEKQRRAYNLFDSGSQSAMFYNELWGNEDNLINAKRWFGKSLAVEQEIEKAKKKGGYVSNSGSWVPDDGYHGRVVIDPTGLYFNKIARAEAAQRLESLRTLWDEINTQKFWEKDQYDRKQEGQSILDNLLDAFGSAYSPKMENLSTHVELDAFLEQYACGTQEIAGENLKSFKDTVTELIDKSFGRQDRNTGRKYGLRKINNLFNEHGVNYELVAATPQKGPWYVKRRDNSDIDVTDKDDGIRSKGKHPDDAVASEDKGIASGHTQHVYKSRPPIDDSTEVKRNDVVLQETCRSLKENGDGGRCTAVECHLPHEIETDVQLHPVDTDDQTTTKEVIVPSEISDLLRKKGAENRNKFRRPIPDARKKGSAQVKCKGEDSKDE